jgi:Tol biopolymer transport system component
VTHGGGLFPRWSRDGRTIYAQTPASNISSVEVGGGDPRPVLVNDPTRGFSTMEFSLAPDGHAFAFASGRAPDRRIWRGAAGGRDLTPLTKGQGGAPSWSPDSKWIYFTTFRDSGGITPQLERPGLNIWRVSPDGTREEAVTQFAGRRGYLGQNIANDGRHVYFTWREDVADIWMMDVRNR